MRSRNEVRSVGHSNVSPPTRGEYFPQMSGFDPNASTPRKATKANRAADSCQLCTPSVFVREVSRTAGQDASSLIEPDRCGLTDVRHPPDSDQIPERRDMTRR